jgi:hypothetical protein
MSHSSFMVRVCLGAVGLDSRPLAKLCRGELGLVIKMFC